MEYAAPRLAQRKREATLPSTTLSGALLLAVGAVSERLAEGGEAAALAAPRPTLLDGDADILRRPGLPSVVTDSRPITGPLRLPLPPLRHPLPPGPAREGAETGGIRPLIAPRPTEGLMDNAA